MQRLGGQVLGAESSLHQSESSEGALEFVHFGLTAKYQLPTALARLRERGIPRAGWVRDSLIWHEANNPSHQALPYPLPSERAVINCGPAVNPNIELERRAAPAT